VSAALLSPGASGPDVSPGSARSSGSSSAHAASGAPAAARRAGRRRTRRVLGALVLLLLVAVGASLTWGGLTGEVLGHLGALLGLPGGEESFVVGTLRLPRVAMSVLAGVAFGLSGTLFQTVLRNPLASPDVLGISGGASLAAAWAILVLGVSGAAVSAAAFGGALTVAAAIYLLSWRGGVSGYRFVLVGVSLAFAVSSGLGYLLTRAAVDEVRAVLVWTVGSIGTPRWSAVGLLAGALVVLAPAVAVAAHRLRALELGDDLAGGLGVRPDLARLGVLAVGVALAAVATSQVGPIAFVAFVSGPIARRLLPGTGPALPASALVGAVVVVLAELVAQHGLGSLEVPVGIVTGLVGAPYLLWLLATLNRKGHGA